MGDNNIQFLKKTMTSVDGYFYMFDEDLDMLLEKTADGTTAFSYPMDSVISNDILSTEYDGVNFWTLEVGQVSGSDMVIRRWFINNYICKLQDKFDLIGSSSHLYRSNAFSVEHYHTTVTGTHFAGETTILMETGYSAKLVSGMSVTLGPNTNGLSETINVFTSIEGSVTLEDPIVNNYVPDDPVQFYNNIWLFNNSDGTDTSNGALYKLNAYTGSYITRYAGGAYKDITSTTFSNVDCFAAHGAVDALLYVKGANILFVNIDTGGIYLNYYGSMVIDNISGQTVQGVWDLAVSDSNIYRLQTIGAGYNYVLSTLNSIVSSIALEASPAIITANEVSSSTVTANVKDQFFQPVQARLVTFVYTAGLDTGYLTGANPANTDTNGIASIVYVSGNLAKQVVISATVDQT